jgi:hypothetical protein
MKEELLKELDEACEVLSDFAVFKNLFSDKPEGTLTRLFRTLKQISALAKLQEIRDVVTTNKPIDEGLFGERTGKMVLIRPCGDEYENKTFIGFYLGDIATGSSMCIKDDKVVVDFSGHNPAIFVPELGKIIYGYESWWGEIKSEEDFKKITNENIQNVWYVKLLKVMMEKEENAKMAAEAAEQQYDAMASEIETQNNEEIECREAEEI